VRGVEMGLSRARSGTLIQLLGHYPLIWAARMPLEGCGKSLQKRNKDPIFSSQFTGTKILVVKLHTEAIDEAQELSSVSLICIDII
jgi:hypothetical protein